MLTVVTWTVALSVYAHGLPAGPAATRYADWYHAHHEHHPVMPESVPVAEQRPLNLPPVSKPAARCRGRSWLELLTAPCPRFILERHGSGVTTWLTRPARHLWPVVSILRRTLAGRLQRHWHQGQAEGGSTLEHQAVRFARLTQRPVRVLGGPAVRAALGRQSQPDLNTTYGGPTPCWVVRGGTNASPDWLMRNHPVGVRRPHPKGVMSARRLGAMVRRWSDAARQGGRPRTRGGIGR
jgi:hypothetical protein